jgi:glycosyltransferase involved in cell wall biosynthesis
MIPIDLSLSIPFYNEEACTEKVVSDLVRVLENKKVNYELILINNGSNDRTISILRRLEKKNKKLVILDYKKNINPSGVIIEALKAARGKYVGFTAGDGEISALDTYKVYEALVKKGYEVCKTVRIKRKDGFTRRISSYIFNLLVICFFNLWVEDVNGYPLLMKKEVWMTINTKVKNLMINVDILYKSKKKHFKLGKIFVVHRKRAGGTSRVYNARKPMQSFRLLEMLKDFIIYRLQN